MLVNGLIRLGTTNDGGTCIGQRGSALLPTGHLFVYLSQMPPLHRGNGQTLPVVLSGSCRRDVRYIDNWLYVLKTSFPVTTLTSLH